MGIGADVAVERSLKEAKEELGIDTASGNTSIAGMVEDPVNGVFDVGLIQALAMSGDEIQENFRRHAGNEYDAIRVVSLKVLNEFLATERVNAVSRKLICMFLHDRQQHEMPLSVFPQPAPQQGQDDQGRQ